MVIRTAQHHRDDGVKYDDVKVGEIVDQGAGCFLERREDEWVQWDGGHGLVINETQVREWLN